MSKINVICSGGCVQDVLDDNGNSIEYSVIDFDLPEYGECPVCNEEIPDADNDTTCPKCGYRVWEEDTQKAVKCLENWRNWK